MRTKTILEHRSSAYITSIKAKAIYSGGTTHYVVYLTPYDPDTGKVQAQKSRRRASFLDKYAALTFVINPIRRSLQRFGVA